MSLVSVIIPVYNLERCIKDCLECFLGQSFRDFELIFVNDGSTDSTEEIIKSYEGAFEGRVKLFKIEKSNAGRARNFGLQKAEGKWVIFFDGDDFCEKDFLQKMVKKAEEWDLDIGICASYEYNERKKKYSKHRVSHLLTNLPKELFNCAVPLSKMGEEALYDVLQLAEPWNKIYKKNFLEKGGFKFQEISNSNDTSFFFETIFAAEKIGFLRDELVISRRGRRGSLSLNSNKNWRNYFLAYEKSDEAITKYENFYYTIYPYSKRKFEVYKYFFKKTGLLNKIPFLTEVLKEIKKTNAMLQKNEFSLLKFLFS